MYTSHFGLRGEAFSLSPDPFFLYLSPDHAEALAAIKVGLETRRGLMVMTGEVGTGKTTLLYTLLGELGPVVRTAYISNTRLSFDELLSEALTDFGVEGKHRDRPALLAALNTFLTACANNGAVAALVIDEAQNLTDDMFEDLRLLSNFETFTTKLLQIVLVGQPELELALSKPSLRQVADRVAVRCRINPLSSRESRRYVRHRLQRAGGSPELLTPGALRLVVKECRGIPRRINIICHNALLFAYGRACPRVSRSFVKAAIRQRQGRRLVVLDRRRPPRLLLSQSRFWQRLVAAAVVGAVAAAGGLAWESDLGRWNGVSEESAFKPAPAKPSAHSRVVQRPSEAEEPAASRQSLHFGQGQEGPHQREEETQKAKLAETRSKGPARAHHQSPRKPHGKPHSRPQSDFVAVRVRPGATLTSLARMIYGEANKAALDRIMVANPQITNPDRILAGHVLRFPQPGVGAQSNTEE